MDFLPKLLLLSSLLCSVCGQAPVVSVEPHIASIRQGETVSFRCQVKSGATPVQLKWRRANNQGLPGNVKVISEGSELIVNNSQPENQGQYLCVATNSAGQGNASATLNVKYPPNAICLPDQVRLHPGDTLSVQCLAEGTNPISFEWSRVGSGDMPAEAETTTDGKLLIAEVQQGDSGTYKCVATNHIGSSEALAKVIVRA